MKLVSFIILSLVAPFTNAFEHPSFSSKANGVESYFSPLKASNLVSYNTNTGALLTGFDIKIPVLNKELLSTLNFQYSSFSSINQGYGIGFKLKLPRFYENINLL